MRATASAAVASLVLGVIGMLLGTYLLVNPHWILDFFWGGDAAPVAYQALTYTDAFLQRKGPVLLAMLLLNIPLFVVVIVTGRRSTTLRRIETVLGVLMCAVMLWAVAGGPILMLAHSDRLAKSLVVLIVAFTLIHYGIQLYRNVRPTPRGHVQVSR